MAARKTLLIEWKARDLKLKHAWIVDRHGNTEAPCCDPERSSGYIDPKRVSYRSLINGVECKKCLKIFPLLAAKFGDKLEVVRISGTDEEKKDQLANAFIRGLK